MSHGKAIPNDAAEQIQEDTGAAVHAGVMEA
jgi:hypothetical protein